MDTDRTPSKPDDERLALHRQHTQLAQMLDELEASANAVLSGKGEARTLHGALGALHTRLLRHLEYEETKLPSWGREKGGECRAAVARLLLEDHGEQRRRIEGLAHDRSVFSDDKTLAREALTFAHALRRDIEKEDKALRTLA